MAGFNQVTQKHLGLAVTNPKHMGHGVEIVSRYGQNQPEKSLENRGITNWRINVQPWTQNRRRCT